MSRIGKAPITVPSNVEIKIDGNKVFVKGPKGELAKELPKKHVKIEQKDGEIIVTRDSDDREARSFHGLTRSLINNMVLGVTEGFSKTMEINGVGYRFQVAGKTLKLELGFSHPVELPIPEGVVVEQDQKNKNVMKVSGIDKQAVGQFCANVRQYRLPEPYKGKGIKYQGEHIERKAGKTAASAA